MCPAYMPQLICGDYTSILAGRRSVSPLQWILSYHSVLMDIIAQPCIKLSSTLRSFLAPESAPVNVVLRSIVEKAFPVDLAARRTEVSQAASKVVLPLFCLSDALFPGQVSSGALVMRDAAPAINARV